MINVNELMLGNWVRVDYPSPIDATYHTIESIRKDNVVSLSGREYVASNQVLSPIELTPEILEKCGFVKVNGKPDIFRTEDNVYQISYGGDANSLFYREYNPNEYCYLMGNLYYLHQLQNLYHALTSTALKVQL